LPLLRFSCIPPAPPGLPPLLLRDALPISAADDRHDAGIRELKELHQAALARPVRLRDAHDRPLQPLAAIDDGPFGLELRLPVDVDRKSTRLNSSHVKNSYAVFCLKTQHDC